MQRPTARERVRYAVDNILSRGLGPVVLGLFAITALVVVVVSLVIWVLGWGNAEDATPLGYLDIVWRAILTTIDTGAVGNYTGGPATTGFLLAMFAITLVGIFVTSILIGILVTSIQGRLEESRKGRSRVLETGHTVILGWSQGIYTILSELVIANQNQPRSTIAILADRDKVQMEDDIRARIGATGRTRLICRSGNPIDLTDLRIANVDTAKSIILLSPETDDPDADIIKTILAITNNPRRRPEPYHVVAELRDPASLEVADIVGRGEVQVVLAGDVIARIIAQTCRQSGLSIVYSELLDFEGDEIYIVDAPDVVVGRSFGEALFWFEDSSIIGVAADGSTRLNPPMDTTIRKGDRLIAISADDDTVRSADHPVAGLPDGLIEPVGSPPPRPERTLILGWNWRAASIVRELGAYAPPGSRVVVLTDQKGPEVEVSGVAPTLGHISLDARQGDLTSRAVLSAVCQEGFDHVIVLPSDGLDPQRADTRTLITLIHLREIVALNEQRFSITSEMLDLRNRALADVTRADDFIVSDRLVSLLVSQLSENAALKGVFDDLFDAEGSEIYLRPVGAYVKTAQLTNFATVVEAARQRGEVAIGYRRKAYAADATRSYGVVINPRKSEPVTFEPADRVIVIADEG